MSLPPLPPLAPELQGKPIVRWFGRMFSKYSGWRITALPNVPKAVVLAAPHSSNWDGLLGVLGAAGIGVRINWMGKHQLFNWPLGIAMRAFGGIATDRGSAHGVVDQFAMKLAEAEQLWIVLAPEGTRKKVKKWRTGFWHIAKKAGVPIVPGFVDFPSKTIGFGDPIELSDDLEADLQKLYAFYAPYHGKNSKSALPEGVDPRQYL